MSWSSNAYKWERIAPWEGVWVDDQLYSALKAIRATLDAASWQEFHDRAAREWSIESGEIEGAFHVDEDATGHLIEHGFTANLIGPQVNGLSPEDVHQLLLDRKDALDGVFGFVKTARKLSVGYIRELHQALMRSADTYDGYIEDPITKEVRVVQLPLKKGEFRTLPNTPSRDGGSAHEYCPAEHVEAEMDQLIRLHERMQEQEVPPLVQAAWLHHAFTQIHPFQDGNGRVARALASVALIQGELMPFTVRRNMRWRYIQALRDADGGDPRNLISLFRSCVHRLAVGLWRQARIREELKLDEDHPIDVLLTTMVKNLRTRNDLTPGDWGKSNKLLLELLSFTKSFLAETAATVTQRLSQPGIRFSCLHGETEYGADAVGVEKVEGWETDPSALSKERLHVQMLVFRSRTEARLLIGFDRFHPVRDGFVGVVAVLEIDGTFQQLCPTFFVHFMSPSVGSSFEEWLRKATNLALIRSSDFV